MDIILVGTNHANQLVGSKSGAENVFSEYLADLCQTEAIDLLAEELNEEAIALWKAQDSRARRLAVQRKMPHLFCDPSATERRAIGILSYEELRTKFGYMRVLTLEQATHLENEERKYWPLREAFWFRRLAAVSPKKCLFILGSNHVYTFTALLSKQGFSAKDKSFDRER